LIYPAAETAGNLMQGNFFHLYSLAKPRGKTTENTLAAHLIAQHDFIIAKIVPGKKAGMIMLSTQCY